MLVAKIAGDCKRDYNKMFFYYQIGYMKRIYKLMKRFLW